MKAVATYEIAVSPIAEGEIAVLGNVRGHPRLCEGSAVCEVVYTTPILLVHDNGTDFETWNTTYRKVAA